MVKYISNDETELPIAISGCYCILCAVDKDVNIIQLKQENIVLRTININGYTITSTDSDNNPIDNVHVLILKDSDNKRRMPTLVVFEDLDANTEYIISKYITDAPDNTIITTEQAPETPTEVKPFNIVLDMSEVEKLAIQNKYLPVCDKTQQILNSVGLSYIIEPTMRRYKSGAAADSGYNFYYDNIRYESNNALVSVFIHEIAHNKFTYVHEGTSQAAMDILTWKKGALCGSALGGSHPLPVLSPKRYSLPILYGIAFMFNK